VFPPRATIIYDNMNHQPGLAAANSHTMESSCSSSNHVAAANNSDDQHRPSKRIRTPTKTYSAEPANDSLSREEQRMLAQAISNSEKDLNIDPEQLTSIPFGPTFYPTVEEFNGDPLLYLATIRAEAEKYGECFARW